MDYILGKIKEATELLPTTGAEDQLFRSAVLQTYTDAYNKLSNAKLRHTMVTDEVIRYFKEDRNYSYDRMKYIEGWVEDVANKKYKGFNNIRLNKYRQQGIVNAYDDIISHLTLD